MSPRTLRRDCEALSAAVKVVIASGVDEESKLALMRQVASANSQYCLRRSEDIRRDLYD